MPDDHFSKIDCSEALHMEAVALLRNARAVGIDLLHARAQEHSVGTLNSIPGLEGIARYFVEIALFLKVFQGLRIRGDGLEELQV